MHELSVTQSILDISLRHASTEGAKRITDIYLVIGQLSSIVDDSVQFYWDIIAKGTIAEGAILHFKRTPAQLTCLDCQYIYLLEDGNFGCPSCQGTSAKILSGDEFYIEAINIETDP